MENSPQKKTILVTGGAGFIGLHLIERLLKDGHRVISLDNYFTGTKENHIAGAEYREGHTKDIAKHISETPDIIYHLGEYSRVAKSFDEPGVVFDLNMVGTFAVLEFWRKHQCKLVYAGSSTKHAEVREDGVLGRNLSPYTWAKAANSDLVVNYARWYSLSYAITYFYNVYGPRERGEGERGTFIEICKERYLKGEPHKIASPGTQTRAFTHVEDTVSGIIAAGECVESDEYGISAKEVHSLLDVARMFGGDVEFLPQTRSTRSTGAVDTTNLEKLGWKQEHTLEDYIKKLKK
ncbi:MAG: hypothetical protein A2494_02570 [Candidatus Lloydbacteria bacterium RIFOXYC12_FULL_46_25]|uniref:NAD-dependent epimerase/dehydratase domain-containing protein n=1 Tax=Candidatus Lloydbacteria bacterium RIFOXYC12_FULL_46_25 TaxID=1798670 RepID=A0A1G2DY95_9BACT|nr:MAG: hypothetical protein A2494_02570 [Candidatus Lloydbacteria bacterium RIFOXYC12_FULL_46_25]